MTGGILKRAHQPIASGGTMADLASLQGEIQGVLARTLNIDPPDPATDLLGTGVLDSLGIVELVAELEAHYAIHVPMETLELDEVRSVPAITALVTRLRGGAGTAS